MIFALLFFGIFLRTTFSRRLAPLDVLFLEMQFATNITEFIKTRNEIGNILSEKTFDFGPIPKSRVGTLCSRYTHAIGHQYFDNFRLSDNKDKVQHCVNNANYGNSQDTDFSLMLWNLMQDVFIDTNDVRLNVSLLTIVVAEGSNTLSGTDLYPTEAESLRTNPNMMFVVYTDSQQNKSILEKITGNPERVVLYTNPVDLDKKVRNAICAKNGDEYIIRNGHQICAGVYLICNAFVTSIMIFALYVISFLKA